MNSPNRVDAMNYLLIEGAFQSTSLCRYAHVFADWGKGTGKYPVP